MVGYRANQAILLYSSIASIITKPHVTGTWRNYFYNLTHSQRHPQRKPRYILRYQYETREAGVMGEGPVRKKRRRTYRQPPT